MSTAQDYSERPSRRQRYPMAQERPSAPAPTRAGLAAIAEAEIEHRIRFPFLYGMGVTEAAAMADNRERAITSHMRFIANGRRA